VANTAANRLLTFGVRGRENLLRQHALGALVFLLTLGLTSGAIAVLEALDPNPSRLLEAAVLIVASACATISRFIGLRSWVFAPAPEEREPPTRLPACSRSA
jgi:putative flippase GtrA